MTSKSAKREMLKPKREIVTHAPNPISVSYSAVNASSGDGVKSIY